MPLPQTYPRMLQERAEMRFNELDEKRRRRFSSIKTAVAMRAFVGKCRADLKRIYSLPMGKKPLNTRITGEIKHQRYSIRKLIFESRPGFLVAANLYAPDTAAMPHPGVVIPCGHALEGKAYPDYQRLAAGLATKGFAVMIYDPIGQGERVHYPEHGGLCMEHNILGKKLWLVGDQLAAWMAWDGIRALDCLIASAPIDPQRIGVVGNSGGGTLTSILMAVEDRFTMGAPSCAMTTFRHNLQNEIAGDAEQIPLNMLGRLYEMHDHLTASAPKPVLLLAKDADFFDIRGVREAHTHLKKVYSILGSPENIRLFTAPGGHGIDLKSREELYSFFCAHAGIKGKRAEGDVATHKPEELWATKGGSVTAMGSRLVCDFVREEARRRRPRWRFSRDTLKGLLGLETVGAVVPDYRVIRLWKHDNRHYARFAVEIEGEARVIVKYLLRDVYDLKFPEGARAKVYVTGEDYEKEASDSEMRKLIGLDGKTDVFIVDLPGIGESFSRTSPIDGDAIHAIAGSDYLYSAYALMMGDSVLGLRVRGLLRLIALLKAKGYKDIELIGNGLGGLCALSAAVFEGGIKKLVLVNSLKSYSSILDQGYYKWPLSGMMIGVLKHFDIPDIVAHVRETCEVVVKGRFDIDMEPLALGDVGISGTRCGRTSSSPTDGKRGMRRLPCLGTGKTRGTAKPT